MPTRIARGTGGLVSMIEESPARPYPARAARFGRQYLPIAAGWELAVHKIIQTKIDRFKELLKTETDPTKRAMLRRLLTEEEVKLKQLPKFAIKDAYGPSRNQGRTDNKDSAVTRSSGRTAVAGA